VRSTGFKIAEDGLSNGVWAVDTFYNEGTGKWPVTIPSDIDDGDYLIRGEIIALHSASTYPGGKSLAFSHRFPSQMR
jgi:hypothetical protein